MVSNSEYDSSHTPCFVTPCIIGVYASMPLGSRKPVKELNRVYEYKLSKMTVFFHNN